VIVLNKTNPTTPRKEPAQARSKALVDAIIEATARVLIAGGLEALNTNEVAAVAGVSVGSLYQYFPSKEALLASLIERELSDDLAQAYAMLTAAGDEVRPVVEGFCHHMVTRACAQHTLHTHLLPLVPHLERDALVSARFGELCQALTGWFWARREQLDVTWRALSYERFEARVLIMLRALEAMLNAAKVERSSLLETPELLIQDMSQVACSLLGLYEQNISSV